jgi:phosphoribosyl-dephospho-CoA transferase
MPPFDVPHRHDWLYLPEDWQQKLAAPLAADDRQALAGWIARRRPLVVARRNEGDDPRLLRLGLALPGKKRVSLILEAQAAGLRRRPPFLLDAIECGAPFWPQAMRDLGSIIARFAPETRVFGSFAWQFFADDPSCAYITPRSDIDLLFAPRHAGQLADWISLLRDFERRWPAPRLDGEIALPGGEFVAWREFAARPKKILVKGGDRVSLRPIDEVDALLCARAA